MTETELSSVVTLFNITAAILLNENTVATVVGELPAWATVSLLVTLGLHFYNGNSAIIFSSGMGTSEFLQKNVRLYLARTSFAIR